MFFWFGRIKSGLERMKLMRWFLNTFPDTTGLTVICVEAEYARAIKDVEGK
jgi:hypothetical protein